MVRLGCDMCLCKQASKVATAELSGTGLFPRLRRLPLMGSHPIHHERNSNETLLASNNNKKQKKRNLNLLIVQMGMRSGTSSRYIFRMPGYMERPLPQRWALSAVALFQVAC